MKLIQGIIRNDRLKDVQRALEKIGVTVYTLSATIGSGERHRGDADDRGSLRPHLRLEIAVPDSLEDHVIAAIRSAADVGESAEGVIFVLPLQRAVKIRTGQEGNPAIMPDNYVLTEADLVR